MKPTQITKDVSTLSRDELVQLVRDQQCLLEKERHAQQEVELLRLKLYEQETLFHQLLDGAKAGYWDWRIGSDYEFLSPRFKAMFGYDEQTMPNHPSSWKKIIHPDDVRKVEEAFERHAASGGQAPFSAMIRCFHRSGTMHWVYCHGQIVEWDEAGKPQRVVGLHLDLSLEGKENPIMTQLHQLSRKAFISSLSHEIRTPLNSIMGLSNLLLEDLPRPEQAKMLRLILFSAETLLHNLNGIQDYQQIEADPIQLEEKPLLLKEITNHVFSAFQPLVRAKGNTLQLEFDEALDIPLKGDRNRLTQLLNHLLSHALNSTDCGKITVSLRCLQAHATNIRLELTVHDTSIGNTSGQFNLLGGSTQELTGASYASFNNGFELSIAQKLVRLHEGTLHREHQPGQGTSVHCLLTLKKADPAVVQPATPVQTSSHSLEDIRVLVAEDNVINQLVVKRFLKQWQAARADFACDGRQVLEMLEQHEYDVILMDLSMPEVDGYEATRQIRQRIPAEKLPIIALTATISPEVEESIRQVGMNDFIGKPFQPTHLYEAIRKVVTKQKVYT
ncbi:PAS domain S-box-containing protein [Catalinimonas alkaloidigena]|uniref:histidine kinase n=1 Tax=Catalinimonas alkaloidigena TaxID=1075417 RepID=A0A1G9PI96_9BACT|nr:PAS domain-containing hybrid sensor histidine kinase/response regulator [Catalinimonas alkaloidigena]SDL98500.1 PAS domain S-box-containing protein [Catalinimonas alkaloidigena]